MEGVGSMRLHQNFFSIPVIIVVAVLLSACGGGSSGTSSDATIVSDNAVETVPEPVAEPTPEPVAEPVPEPVSEPVSGTVTGAIDLTWTAPSTRADGTPLSLAEISGYRIYYGESEGDYPNSADVADGTATSATVTDIPVGNYYLVMTTYDVDGRESGYSSAIQKTAL